jgi:hypothetical protein
MDRLTIIFWLLIALLVSAALFFGLNAEQQRRRVQSGKGTIESGDLVRLVKVINGDALVMINEWRGATP